MRPLPLLVLVRALFFAGVWFGRRRERATEPPPRQARPPSRQQIVDGFHKIYYDASTYTWSATRWLGAPVVKNPLDLWVMQEIVYETRPDVIIEAGTYLADAAAKHILTDNPRGGCGRSVSGRQLEDEGRQRSAIQAEGLECR